MLLFLSLKVILYFLKNEQISFYLKKLLIKQGAHLTTLGLTEIVSIKASMYKGLSEKLAAQFTDISLVERPAVTNQSIRDGN